MSVEIGKRDGNIVLWAVKKGKEFVDQQMQDIVWLTSYKKWHKAFCHVSPQKIQSFCYSSKNLILSAPANFEYHICELTKARTSEHLTVTSPTNEYFELVHSGL